MTTFKVGLVLLLKEIKQVESFIKNLIYKRIYGNCFDPDKKNFMCIFFKSVNEVKIRIMYKNHAEGDVKSDALSVVMF